MCAAGLHILPAIAARPATPATSQEVLSHKGLFGFLAAAWVAHWRRRRISWLRRGCAEVGRATTFHTVRRRQLVVNRQRCKVGRETAGRYCTFAIRPSRDLFLTPRLASPT